MSASISGCRSRRGGTRRRWASATWHPARGCRPARRCETSRPSPCHQPCASTRRHCRQQRGQHMTHPRACSSSALWQHASSRGSWAAHSGSIPDTRALWQHTVTRGGAIKIVTKGAYSMITKFCGGAGAAAAAAASAISGRYAIRSSQLHNSITPRSSSHWQLWWPK